MPDPQTLVEILNQRDKIKDPRIEAAFLAIPRQTFLPQQPPEKVYTDSSIVITYDDHDNALVSSIMPSMLAEMLHQADLRAGQNVLEIGTGTGYFAALLRHVLGPDSTVTSVEIDRDMAQTAERNLMRLGMKNLHIVHADGSEGYAPRASYDRIVSTVGVWDIPAAWVRQLKPNGKLIVPIWLDGLQVVATFVKESEDLLLSETNTPGAFVYMRGEASGPRVSKRVGSTSLTLLADDINDIDVAALHLLLSEDQSYDHLSTSLASEEYWYGFLPYVMLHEPASDVFALYEVRGDQKAYGMSGEGFALIMPGSVCFVPYFGAGSTYSFAGADAFLEVEKQLDNWKAAGRPGLAQLRLRLVAMATRNRPQITTGKLYQRRIHYLHVWQENVTEDSTEDANATP